MVLPLNGINLSSAPNAPGANRVFPGGQPMLSPSNAWRILCTRTGGRISRATFYRWVSNGKVYSVRLGFRIFIPLSALEDLVKRCKAGDRF
jgi:hypothetical protein